MAYADEVLADSPISYWRLGTGGTDVDDEIAAHALTKTGTPAEIAGLLTGDADTARDFPTGANYYETADHADFDFTGTTAFTVECWVDADTIDTTFRRIVSHEDGTNGWVLGVHSSGFFFGRAVAAAFQLAQAGTPSINTRYHVVGTYDGAQVEIFVNGASIDTTADVRTMVASTGTVRIGEASTGGGNDFDGVIDEVAIYSGELSGARITAHYNAGITAAGGGARKLMLLGAA